MRVRFLLPVIALAAACNGDSDPPTGTAIDLAAITRGVWQVEIEAVVDTCRPEQLVGEYYGAIRDFDDGGGEGGATISIFVPERGMGTGVFTRPVPFSSAHIAYGIPGQQENCTTGGHARDLLITTAEPTRFEMTVTDDWTNLIGCEEGGVAPIGDCHAERLHRYSLVEECAEPCTIIATGEAVPLVCDCAPMEGS
jgi:hypothetical protein